MTSDVHPQLSTETFIAYRMHLQSSPELVLQPKLARLANGTLTAFNLTTREPEPEPEKKAKAPLWMALPVQIVMCLMAGIVVLSLCIALPVLGVLCVIEDWCHRLLSRGQQ